MTKRKRGSCITTEAITDWSEASESPRAQPESDETIANWEDSASDVASQSNVASYQCGQPGWSQYR